MPDLPLGTVTFLFSDIEGSTRLALSQGEAWAALLAEHRRLLRDAFEANGGVEVSTEGDSFFVAFPSATGAVRAAVEGQRALAAHPWPPGVSLRVRMGLHTADRAELAESNYVGVDVHRAARIAAAAHGGQVLVSPATGILVSGGLSDGVGLRDLGVFRLKDLPDPQPLMQLDIEGVESEFPPPRTLDASPHHLPPQATSFVGRSDEIAQIRELVLRNRLVTLTGPGGTGKTRLSLQVASQLTENFPDGVTFAPMAPVREVELVLPTVAKTLGLSQVGPRPIEVIAEHLAERRVLLVLDNLEQVIEAASDIGELLARVSNLSILATSRGPLRVYGEQEYPVPPLPMPDPRRLADGADIAGFAAIQLFVERARSVRPDFALTDANARAVAEICWGLDGLPLAIELAAARVRILSPQDIRARLGGRLDLGASGARDVPERQQTLRGAIAWSHDLLDEYDRRFFASFAVFAGGADLAAIEEVVAFGGRDPLECVASLLDKSLLRADTDAEGASRFVMLETIREYAAEQLAGRDDAAALRASHARHYLERAETAAARIFSPEQRTALDAVERDHDNLRAALTHAVNSGDVVTALRIVTACWRFWQMRGYLTEGGERARRVLEMDGVDEHPVELASALEAAGGIEYWQAELRRARDFYRRALELHRRRGDESAIANALYNVAMTFALEGERFPTDTSPEALTIADEALTIFRRLGDRAGEGRVLWAMLDMAVIARRTDEANALGEQCIQIFTEIGDRFMLAWTEFMVGLNDTLSDRPDAARDHLRHALETFRDSDDRSGYALVFDGLATLAFRGGDPIRAMRLAGAAEAVQRTGGAMLGALNRAWAGFHPEELLSDPELAARYEEGRRLELPDAVELAMSEAR